MDTTLFFLINRDLALPWLDPVMVWFSRWWFAAMLGILTLRLPREKGRLLIVAALAVAALGAADFLGALAKETVGRARPCAGLDGVRVLLGCGGSGSFPSNHAAGAFAVAAVLGLTLGAPAATGAFFVAGIAGYSRVYVGAHFPGDVLGGALLGAALGLATVKTAVGPLQSFVKKSPERASLAMVLFLLAVFRLVYAARGPLDLAGDEAHYWEWSRRLDWSYYSKGPFVAYWIRLFTALLGTSEVAIRAGAGLLSVLTSVLLFDLGRRLYHSERAGLWAALLYQVTPVFFVYGVVMTIDPPFFFFWSLGFWLFVKAAGVGTGGKVGGWGLWLGLGLAVGVGMLAKYTMALFAGCAFLALLAAPEGRRILLRPGPYVALCFAAAAFSPVIYWNAAHSWVTFRHTAGQVALDEGMTISLQSAVNFLGSQIGVIGPLMLPALLWALASDGDRPRRRLIAMFSLPVLFFFLLKSFQAKVQGNWALPGYIALYLPLGAAAAGSARGILPRFIRAAVGLSLVMTVLMLSPNTVHRLGFRISGQDKMIGWAELGRKVGAMRDAMPQPSRTFIASDYYMVASELAFYVPGNPETFAVNIGGRRMNQYDLWPGLGPGHSGWDGLFVIMGRSAAPAAVRNAFNHVETITLDVGTEMVQRPFTIFRGSGFAGFPPLEVKSY